MNLRSTLILLSVFATGFVAFKSFKPSPVEVEAVLFNPVENPQPDTITVTKSAATVVSNSLVPLSPCAGTVTGLTGAGPWTPNGGLALLYTFTAAGVDSLRTSDNKYAKYTRTAAGHSNCLDLTNLGFNIPSGAIILGIKLSVEKSKTGANNVLDSLVTLLNPSSGAPSNKKDPVNWPTTDAVTDYGGITDLWGATWTPASVNQSAFGARIKIRFTGAAVARLDSVSISVRYAVPPKQGTPKTVSTNSTGTCSTTSSLAWNNLNAANLQSDNGVYVTTTTAALSIDSSNCLDVSNFGFCICPTAKVDSISVEIDRGAILGLAQDLKVTLLKPGGIETQNKAKIGVNWPLLVDGRVSYGGDTWGATWTPAMINDPAFGVRIKIIMGSLLAQARIDEVLVKVYCSFPQNIKIYVDSSATGLNDGSSWANAYTHLEDALDDCFVDTICVAQGTYYPYNGDPTSIFGGERSMTFNIPDSTVVQGGFPSGGAGPRNWQCNKTILSGDIDHDGLLNNKNSYHVVTTTNVSSVTVVDGFCIRDGNANTTGDDRFGGGWFNNGRGPGKASNPTILNCFFINNNALRHGGAMANYGDGGEASPMIINSQFRANAAGRGGAIFNYGGAGKSSPSLINCILSGNLAVRDAANLADRPGFGGAMYNDGNGDGICAPKITNCDFVGNLAYRGGAMYNVASSDNSSAVIVNSILWNNSATNQGNVFYNEGSAATTVSYSIIQSPSSASVNDASITGGSTTTVGALNNKFQVNGADPLFIIPITAGLTSTGDFHVKPGSSVINMGNTGIVTTTTDLDGKTRIYDGTVDMGAYESPYKTINCSTFTSNTIYVDSTATGANNGVDWDSAFTNLQDALNAARTCSVIDTIKVAQGTYYPSDSTFYYDVCGNLIIAFPPDRSISFNIPDSLVVQGGYPQGGGVRDIDCGNNKTILCGDVDRNGDTMNNAYHVVTTNFVSDKTVLDGFCISGGNANGAFPDNDGGGWKNEGYGPNKRSNPTILNTIIRGNHAANFGGGMFNDGPQSGTASPILKNVIISENTANFGGGMYNYSFLQGTSSPVLTDVIISGNVASNSGGGVYNGAYLGTCSPIFTNVIISGNVATVYGGGGVFNDGYDGISSPAFTNVVFNGNAAFLGGAMFSKSNVAITSTPVLVNSIVWNNSSSFYNENATTTLSFSIVQSGGFTSGTVGNGVNNNKPDGTDPLFSQAPLSSAAPTTAGDFHVLSTSPAIDMGLNDSVHVATDLDALPRIVHHIVDLGAYEFALICESDTLYVEADGSVPPLPLDSIIGITPTPECILLVNGIAVTSSIPFDCGDLGVNNLNLLLIKLNCNIPDTLYSCTKTVVVLDTFPKLLSGNGQLNVSLDDKCVRELTLYDLLTNFKGCTNDFEVHLQYPFGTNHNVPDNTLDRTHLGYCMIYSVTQKSTGNTTWGKICVEDKYPPQVGDTVEYRTCFQFAQLPSGPSYKVADNCSDSVVVNVVSENFTDYGCDSALYQGLVTRHLIATDAWGNQSNLTKQIYILKVSLDSVICARDTAVDCSLEVVNGVRITDPKRSGAPMVKVGGTLVSLWPNNPSCKLEVLYRDERQDVCGTSYKVLRTWIITDWCSKPAGQEKICKQWIEVKDTTTPVVYDTILPLYFSSPHDCGQYVDLPVLRYSDCNTITETYLLKYYEEGILRILSGKLPASHIWLPTGIDSVEVNVIDACNNIVKGKIYINIIDNTPPTPVCDEYTQVTVDPTSCWSAVAAADLDNGSHDNCCSVLHFAAAKMDSIVYWRNYWNTRLETEVGKADFWRDKAGYDALIEDWINCYVFSDTVHFDECGTNQVVLRVYEACGIPRLDPHVWPCSPHAWFCYNTYLYIGDFNYNWFDPKGPHSCQYRPDLTSLSKVAIKYDSYFDKGYLNPKFIGSAQYNFCNVPFYFGQLGNISKLPPNGGYCSARLYNDCMVNVLVDDKQAPTVDHLEDVTVYCDGAPDWADYPSCDDMYPPYPGELRDSKGIVHGYYGGSSQYDVHMGTGDHNDPQACDQNRGWAPIYCKNWLYLDSFDRGGKVNLSDYFEKPVLVDKKRPLDHTLKANEFTFTDNCRLDDASLTVTNNGTINGCSEGWISRTWTIKDKCGNAVSATQKIIVKHRSDFEVIFPADKKVTCDFLNRTDTSELGAGKPKLSDDDCEQLGVTYKDEIFTVVDSACYKIVRTWTIIDWCLYNPNLPTGQAGQQKRYPDVIVNDSLRANTTDRACVYRSLKDNNDGYIQYVQIIKVIDELKPHITDCSDQTVCIDKDCATAVNIPLSGTDNCSDQIRFRADITRPDGTHDKRSDITAITGSGFTAGAYKIQVIAKDQCGNEDTCNFTLTIKDCKKPTPYCLNGIATVVMPSTGSVQVWAKDFDKGASDNCTEASKLKFSFTKNTADASKTLTCTNIPNGKEQAINVEVWVTDEAGNQDFCSTYILLQDNGDATNPGGVCKDTAALVANVTGKLLTEEQEGVEFANVDVKGMQGMPSIVTSTDGSYSFSSIPMNTDHVSIKALRDDNPMNGVSTLDLVLIQKHILGTESLKSPYKMIAADVDNSNDISAIDLLELRKLILGLYDKLPNNTSWKFIPKSYTFSDPSNPWIYPTEDVLTDMSEKMIRDFVGVKIGDVNSTAAAHNLMGTEIRSGETGLIFEVQDQVFKAGDKVSVEFRSPNFKGVSGFQGTLSTSYEESSRKPQTTPSGAGGRNGIQTLKFESISSSSSLKVSQNNIGRRWEHEGMITMSWNTNTSMDLKDDAVLFTMHFTAQSAGRLSDVLRIGSQHTIAESYEGKGELGNLSIRFVGKDGKEVAGKSELYQNYPNPFDQRTVIGINLAEGIKGNLKITDVTGRTVKSISRDWNKGYNEVWLNRSELQGSGILFYSFESQHFTATKRMILLQ
jgi:hypothetical protein